MVQGDKIEGQSINIGDFSEKRYGINMGGALVEDKLFFFAAYEDFTEPYNTLRGPQGSNAANSATVTQADIDNGSIVNVASTQGEDPNGDTPDDDDEVIVQR